MTVIARERSVDHHRGTRGDRAWLNIDGPPARTVVVGSDVAGVGLVDPASIDDESDGPVRVPVVSSPAVGPRPLRRTRAGSSVACTGSGRPTVHGARLTRRGRIVVGLAWVVLAFVAAAPIVGVVGVDAEPAPTTVTISVTEGDTLWDIARAVDPDSDPRETVSTIVGLNNLDSAGDLRAGDRLVVPAAP